MFGKFLSIICATLFLSGFQCLDDNYKTSMLNRVSAFRLFWLPFFQFHQEFPGFKLPEYIRRSEKRSDENLKNNHGSGRFASEFGRIGLLLDKIYHSRIPLVKNIFGFDDPSGFEHWKPKSLNAFLIKFLPAHTQSHSLDNKMRDSEVSAVIVKLIATKSTLHNCRNLISKE